MFEQSQRAPLALVVLSGGQDSTTCLALAIQEYGLSNVRAVTFDYGQRHRVEIAAAREVAIRAGLALPDDRLIDLNLYHEIVRLNPLTLKGTSPLLSTSKNQVESYASADALPGGLEKTFVPMRNQLFITIAYNRAVLFGLQKSANVDVITGVSQEDYGGYPDCREEFIDTVEMAGHAGLNDPGLPIINIVTPLMTLDKRQTVELSEKIPGARALLSYSHTCYNGEVPPCGKCHACHLRQRGYDQAGVTDPLLERLLGKDVAVSGRGNDDIDP
jgi:7-cyano-7-deazaguanine synthase